ncbi:MAG: c-type cytochrome [Betaproteobacteria bacterium]|nr:c-type cytochrome [Betaproteobacteria bacterium]
MSRTARCGALCALLLLPFAAGAQSAPPPGRLLASNCFQCHGTNGNPTAGFERLAGMSAREVVGELKEMKAKPGEGGIMRVHALGYTDEQLQLIGAFFAQQKPAK